MHTWIGFSLFNAFHSYFIITLTKKNVKNNI